MRHPGGPRRSSARAEQKLSDLDGVPAERIVSVQLCDVRAEPMEPMRAESLGYRLPPGQGYGDSVELVRALAAHGVDPAVMTVEVNDELVGRGVDVAAQVTADAARDVLARAEEARVSPRSRPPPRSIGLSRP